jgi:hypothetical protein
MKFLLIVLAIHLLNELVSKIRKRRIVTDENETAIEIRHPAEYEVRENFEWRVEWW